MENSFNKEKLTSIINILYEERKLYLNHTYRKEIAAWAAMIGYIAIIGFVINFVNSEIIHTTQIIVKISSTFIVISLIGIFFSFIHTQYALIHQSVARCEALLKIITRLYKGKSVDLDKLEILNEDGTPKCIQDEQNKALKRKVPYMGRKHPLRIMLDFILFKWAFGKMDKWRKNDRTRTTQEAGLQWLLLIFGAVAVISIWSDIV